MSELNESVHVVFDDAAVITVPLVDNLTATNAAPTAKTVGDALDEKVDADSIMESVRISVNGVQSDNQGVILIDADDIPVDGDETDPVSIKDALETLDAKTAAGIKYQAVGSDMIKDVVDGIAVDVSTIQEKLYGDQIPMDSSSGAEKIKAAIEAVGGKTASDIIYDGTTTIKAKVDALDSAVTGMDLASVLKVTAQDFTDAQKTQARTNIGAAASADTDPVVAAFSAGFASLFPYVSEDISGTIPLYGEGTATYRLDNACWLYQFGHIVIVTIAFNALAGIGSGQPIMGFPSKTVDGVQVSLPAAGHVAGIISLQGDAAKTIPLFRNGDTVCLGTELVQSAYPGTWRGFMVYGVN